MTDPLVGTNLEFFNTDLEHKIKEASANTEPAWHTVDLSKTGLTIWRIEQFNLVPVSENTYGSFYNGDSYVILAILKDSSNNLVYNIHFWLGQKTTADEMGTSAYKTVELDTFLQGKATQYRELQDNESDLFRSYFLTSLGGTYVPRGIVVLIGGVESGFRHVIPPSFEDYSPILLRIHNYGTTQINIVNGAITEDDVYILDAGLTIYIYAGSSSSHFERLRGEYTAKEIQLNRKNTQIVRLNPDDDEMKQFDIYIDQHISSITQGTTLYTINETGTTKHTTGSVDRQMFDSKNAYVLETPTGAFMWVGKESTLNEMMSAWKVAFKSTPLTTPLVSVREGQEPETFFQYVSK